ncbi:hypothetical protein VB716_01515 [Synechococcus sp. CCY9201]|uniref:hypothetical protein n=1 Tax=unclassified Synechococcus TaxID=2626047 RepID=UPI0018CCACD7|nr:MULTISPECIES: hypothetical protein [unclassified Synechococcus]MEA5421970.1 hypothetical protein [Synechococcus sp. CCY9202]MEA5472900.1 hypothetical protein [Synechococcus sp. CCY9201]QPN61916.1 hypothetical protein H8F24_08925 [Synechococcus sp. CBW1002]QPN68776.1 hypothetical protein H8F26_07860 [Synechococcus sp. CBW1006]CAK6690015.1 hypothetical protein IFHNHDMJ_00728 [Synechococcus sp. CBW1107]
MSVELWSTGLGSRTGIPSSHAGTAEAGAAATPSPQHHEETWDAMEVYFECITTCSLDDGECVTRCVEELREHH